MPLRQKLDQTRIPKHVAIVMDGNGRWAKSQGRPRLYGHKIGVDSVRDIVETSCDLGIEILTLYAFSSENWNRPEDEVSGLMSILQSFLVSELKRMQKNGVKLSCIGDVDRLPSKVQKTLRKTISETDANQKMLLNLALSYGARDEITRAVQNIARSCVDGTLQPEEITSQVIADHLYTKGMNDPDLVIRTGGEARLSNFLLWQVSYSEIYFTQTMWPDFRREQFQQAILDYQTRERRFGKTGEQIETKKG